MYDKKWSVTNTGGADGSTVLEIHDGSIRPFRRFVLQALAGQVRVFGSVDGTNYPTSPLVLSLEPAVDGSDVVTEAQGTFVGKTTGTRLHYFFGQYRSLKILQIGATAAQIIMLGTED